MTDRDPNLAEQALGRIENFPIVGGLAANVGRGVLFVAESLGDTATSVQNVTDVFNKKSTGNIDALDGLVAVVGPEQGLELCREKALETVRMFLRNLVERDQAMLRRKVEIALSELPATETWVTIGLTEPEIDQINTRL